MKGSSRLGLAMSLSLMVCADGYAQTAGLAQDVGGSSLSRLDLFGEAPQACVLRPPLVTALTNATFTPTGTQAATILVTQLADPLTAVPVEATINLAFPVICNGAHEVTVRTANGGLTHVPPVATPGPGFRSSLVYQLTGAWAGQTSSGGANQPTPVDIRTNNGAAGQFSLVVEIPGGGDPLVAGPYSDSLVIELVPAN